MPRKPAPLPPAALGDAVIRLRRIGGTDRLEQPPLATITDLREIVSKQQLRVRRQLEPLLEYLSPHAASPPESHLRLRLSEWHIPQPHLDYDVRTADGLFLGTSEFAWPEFKIATEYEGDHHRRDRKQWNRDIEKYEDYEANGWKIIRVTSDLLYRQPARLLAIHEAAFAKRGWRKP